MSALELRHLRALVALTEEGTFTDAAIRLGVTQSAVSRLIGVLQKIVDTRLVERTTRSVALTAAGVQCYQAAVLALAAVDDVLNAAHGRARPLRLGYAWSALGRYTSEVLQRWRTEHPDVPLEGDRIDERAAGLTRGAVDVAVIRGELDEPGIVTRRIFTEARMAAVPLTHALATRAAVQLSELADSTMLITATGTTTLDLWPTDRRPGSTLRVDNIDEWLTEIAGGLAIGVTTESTAAQYSHPGIAFLPVTDAAPVTVYLGWPSSLRHPATAGFAALVDRVVAATGAHLPN
jgi:DNA-binding transcriptional LysR family regulator